MATTATAPTAIDKVLITLSQHPGSTTKQLADLSMVGAYTAGKALAVLEQQGRVSRTAPESGRGAVTWYPVTREVTADGIEVYRDGEGRAYTIPVDDDAEAAGDVDAVPAQRAPVEPAKPKRAMREDRLAKGGLRDMVEQWLDEHPEETVTPSRLGKVLGRSPGAIFNALERLVKQGGAVQVSANPRTYQAAPE